MATHIRIVKEGSIIIGDIPIKLEAWIVSANKLGVLSNKTLVPELNEKLTITEDEVILSKYWAAHICDRGGWYKREFINWQILAFELWEELNRGEHELKIFVNEEEFELNTNKPREREDNNVIQMIKMYKRLHRTSRGDCKHYADVTLDLHSKLCCICGNKDIILLRRKK